MIQWTYLHPGVFMKPRKYDVPNQVFVANYPIDMLDSFWVIEPDGNVIKMYPMLHADESELKVLRCLIDKKTREHRFTFTSWAEEAGYLALDEELENEGRIDDYKEIVKQDQKVLEARRNGSHAKVEQIPNDYLPQIALDRRAGKTPGREPLTFPKKKKSKKEKEAVAANVG